MLQPESIAKLAGSGNARTVEEEWMRVMEAPDLSVSKLSDYAPVLTNLRTEGKGAQAEALAWAAIETISSRQEPADALAVACPFLLAVGNCPDVRGQVASLYRRVYEDREGLEALLDESGIEGGRPVRRALRTLEVCLTASEGDYLSARDEDGAARIDAIDTSSWEFTIAVPGGNESLGAVHLADRYERALPTDFNVMRSFAIEELTRKLHKEPAEVVIDLCKRRNNVLDSDELQKLLVPAFFTLDEWKKWWPRTRSALKRNPHIELEGRSPYTIRHVEARSDLDESFIVKFDGLREPLERLAAVEEYFRECKARDNPPSEKVARHCYESFCERAKTLIPANKPRAGLLWVIACRVGQMGEIEGCSTGIEEFVDEFADSASDVLSLIDSDALAEVLCESLVRARKADWNERLLALLPLLPMATCDRAAVRLVDAGVDPESFEPVIQKMLTSARKSFQALLWLWSGPTNEQDIVKVTPLAVLMRILRTLDDARLSDAIDKETVRKLSARTRAVLSARKFERFLRCIEGIDAELAGPLRNQLLRNDVLGRAVRDELLRRLSTQFPSLDAPAKVAPWSREDVLFVTQNGMVRKQAQIEELVNVKMKENARAIGAAAEKGDLSENSEYKFALEERDLLRARLAQMNVEFEKAEIITEDLVPKDHLGIGSRAKFRRCGDGHCLAMSFLGPWEADIDAGVYNYQAPMAQKLMGKRIGDNVQFDMDGAEGEYELVELDSAIDD